MSFRLLDYCHSRKKIQVECNYNLLLISENITGNHLTVLVFFNALYTTVGLNRPSSSKNTSFSDARVFKASI